MKHAYNFKDLTGQIFGRLIVVKFSHAKKYKNYWECLCTCGNIKIISRSDLLQGKIKSCGCIKKEQIILKNKTVFKTHGLSHSRIYNIWSAIVQRCTNPNSVHYAAYGGSGIKLCEQWQTFDGFYKDNGESYFKHVEEFGEKNTSFDRFPNQIGNYEPENTKWATIQEQQNNRKSTSESENIDLHTYWRKRLNSMILQCLHRGGISEVFKQRIGCSVFEFKKYITSKFQEGMTWENWGNEQWEWNLDHIVACRHFDLSKEEDRLKCFHYTNFQPLWWKENHDKVKRDNMSLS